MVENDLRYTNDPRRSEFMEKMKTWGEETVFMSGNFTASRYADEVLAFGPDAIPWLVQYLAMCHEDGEFDPKYNPWAAMEAIWRLNPDSQPEIPDDSKGVLKDMLKVYQEWGRENGYIEA